MQSILSSKAYGILAVGRKGKLAIPLEIRKALNIRSGGQLMVFVKPDEKIVSFMPYDYFDKFLKKLKSYRKKKINSIIIFKEE